MTPQFVDFNADGYMDIITGTFDGSPHVSFGTENGFDQPSHILASDGKRMILDQVWDYDEKQWLNTSGEQCISAVAFDWDNDNDYDLLLGDYKKGHLYLRTNSGTNAEPSFSTENVQVKMDDGEPFAVTGGMSAPRLVDWDGDGLTDIVTGGMKTGGVFLYLNTGQLGAPAYGKPITLVPTGGVIDPEGVKSPTSGCYPDAVDYDGDGDLDLLVGGYATWNPAARTLSDEETRRLVELDTEMDDFSSRFQDLMATIQDDLQNATSDEERQKLYQEAYDTDEAKRLMERQQAARQEINRLRPTQKREAGVWLYRRK